MSDTLTSFRARLQAGLDATLAADLEAALNPRLAERGGHTDWGLLCEEAGLLPLAFREFQLALRDDANDAVALFRLAHHYHERGDNPRAAELLERLLPGDPARLDWLALYAQVLREEGAGPRLQQALERAIAYGLPPDRATLLQRGTKQAAACEEEEAAEEAPAEFDPSDADCVRFQNLFGGREDVHARQWAGAGGTGGYSPVQEPLTPAVVRNHLLGTFTVGVYPIRLDGTCTFFAVDLDIDKAALEKAHAQPALARRLRDDVHKEALRLRGVLRELGFIPVLEDSGFKGRHLWVFLEQPEPAGTLHLLGRLLLAGQTPLLPVGLHLEFFPRQSERKGKGLGNLIKLPLGIHRRTGRRALILDGTGKPLSEPLAALRKVMRAPQAVLHAAVERLKGQVPALPAAAPAPVAAEPAPPAGPVTTPPAPAPGWTEADFDADPRLRHLLERCPVLAELKRTVDEHRRLSHEEQLVLIHTLGHVEGGPQAVNYLLGKCVDVGREKFLKDRLKGNPVSCPSIRKKIGHVTRRVPCNCPFDFAADRYPTPVLHLLTLAGPQVPVPPPPPADLENLARRYAAIAARREEIQREFETLQRALIEALRATPDGTIACPGGRYRLVQENGVDELRWEVEPGAGISQARPPAPVGREES
jgi:tetratricopeptide (TPR) repeat protein